MKFNMIAAVAAAATLGFAAGAEAATFTVTGGKAFTLGSDYNPAPGTGAIAPGTEIIRNGTLSLDAPGYVTFSYIGMEAGYTNELWADGAKVFDNKSKTNAPFTLKLGAGGTPFAFNTVDRSEMVKNGESNGYYSSIAFYQTAPSTVYALFNDGSKSDQDYDDIVVRMDVAPVPLPAAGLLLIGGIAGLGALARRRRAAAAAAA